MGNSLGKTIKNQGSGPGLQLNKCLVLYAFTLQAFIYVNGAGNNGQVLISMNYSTSSKALCIHVVKAARLSPTHSSTSANPYVKLYVSSILLILCTPRDTALLASCEARVASLWQHLTLAQVLVERQTCGAEDEDFCLHGITQSWF